MLAVPGAIGKLEAVGSLHYLARIEGLGLGSGLACTTLPAQKPTSPGVSLSTLSFSTSLLHDSRISRASNRSVCYEQQGSTPWGHGKGYSTTHHGGMARGTAQAQRRCRDKLWR